MAIIAELPYKPPVNTNGKRYVLGMYYHEELEYLCQGKVLEFNYRPPKQFLDMCRVKFGFWKVCHYGTPEGNWIVYITTSHYRPRPLHRGSRNGKVILTSGD